MGMLPAPVRCDNPTPLLCPSAADYQFHLVAQSLPQYRHHHNAAPTAQVANRCAPQREGCNAHSGSKNQSNYKNNFAYRIHPHPTDSKQTRAIPLSQAASRLHHGSLQSCHSLDRLVRMGLHSACSKQLFLPAQPPDLKGVQFVHRQRIDGESDGRPVTKHDRLLLRPLNNQYICKPPVHVATKLGARTGHAAVSLHSLDHTHTRMIATCGNCGNPF